VGSLPRRDRRGKTRRDRVPRIGAQNSGWSADSARRFVAAPRVSRLMLWLFTTQLAVVGVMIAIAKVT
jgi:hypothetical protein